MAQSSRISCQPHLLAILLVLDGVHGAAGLGVEHEVEAGVFTEATGIAQEGILLIVIDGPERKAAAQNLQLKAAEAMEQTERARVKEENDS